MCSRVRVCVCVSVRHWCPMAVSLGLRYQAVRPPQHGAGRWPQKGMSTSNPRPCTCGPIWKWGLCGCSYVKDLGEIILGGPFRERCETKKVARGQRRTDRPGPPGGTEAGRGGGVLRRLLPQPTSGIRPQNQEDQCVAFRVPRHPTCGAVIGQPQETLVALPLPAGGATLGASPRALCLSHWAAGRLWRAADRRVRSSAGGLLCGARCCPRPPREQARDRACGASAGQAR